MRYLRAHKRHRDACRAAASSSSTPSSSSLSWRNGSSNGSRMHARTYRRLAMLAACVCVSLLLVSLLLVDTLYASRDGKTRQQRRRDNDDDEVGDDGRVYTMTRPLHRVPPSPFVRCDAHDRNATTPAITTTTATKTTAATTTAASRATPRVWLDTLGNVYVRLNASDDTTHATATARHNSSNNSSQTNTTSLCFVTPNIRVRDRVVRAATTTTTTTTAATTATTTTAAVPVHATHAADKANATRDDDDDNDDDMFVGNAYHTWYSLHAPTAAAPVPRFATADEANTLTHASIFVSIAAYHDPECATTLLSAVRAARSRHRLYFGISEETPRNYNNNNNNNNKNNNYTDDDDDGGGVPLGEHTCMSALLRYTDVEQEALLAGRDDITSTTTTTPTPTGTAAATRTTAAPLQRVRFARTEQERARRLLYGNDAPSSLRVTLRRLTWSQIAQSRGGLATTADELAGLHNNNSNNNNNDNSSHDARKDAVAVPTRMFVHATHLDDSIVCLAGEAETLRDRFLLQLDNATTTTTTTTTAAAAAARSRRRARGGRVFRRGRGGAQERPSAALAGCRVTSRLSRHTHARGPIYSRYATSLLYFDQDYLLFVDSHTRFVRDWDAKMIRRVFQLPTRGVLSHYPNGYTPAHPTREYASTHAMAMCSAVLRNTLDYMPQLGAAWLPLSTRPVLDGFVAGGFLFGDAQFVLDVPLDPLLPYVFVGEEALYSSRLWTTGWDMYTPMELLVLHNYERERAPRFWSVMTSAATHERTLAERRALYFMRRPRPWVVVRQVMAQVERARTGVANASAVPYVDAEARLLVSDTDARASWPLAALQSYYGQGTRRRLADYWRFVQLTDAFVVSRDKEMRLQGGRGLCNATA